MNGRVLETCIKPPHSHMASRNQILLGSVALMRIGQFLWVDQAAVRAMGSLIEILNMPHMSSMTPHQRYGHASIYRLAWNLSQNSSLVHQLQCPHHSVLALCLQLRRRSTTPTAAPIADPLSFLRPAAKKARKILIPNLCHPKLPLLSHPHHRNRNVL